jgi:hypothetical protein
MSASTAVTSYIPASAVNPTQIGCTMKSLRIKATIGTAILAVSSLIGIPIKSYVQQDKTVDTTEPTCIEISPKYWTPYMSKIYARGFMTEEYPSWGRAEWRSLLKLWGKESAWEHTADNPGSSAYGIAQVLNTKHGTPAPLQIEKGLEYIAHRYGKPSVAWSHWRKHKWY